MADPTPSKQTKEELHQKIIDALELNGNMNEKDRWKLLIMVVGDTWETVMGLPKRIETLEDNSILYQAKKSKGVATLWITGISLFFITLHDVLPWLLTHIKAILSLVG